MDLVVGCYEGAQASGEDLRTLSGQRSQSGENRLSFEGSGAEDKGQK